MATIQWNDQVELILSDVDETVADLYLPATPPMVAELTRLLAEERVIFFITGQGLKGVQTRITNQLPAKLRRNILIGSCNGAEVVGHDNEGNLLAKPFYSKYDEIMPESLRRPWRELAQQLIAEFKLITYPTMPVQEFMKESHGNPLAIMFEDRGPQITFEFANSYDLSPEQVEALTISVPETHGSYDLRIQVMERADELLQAAQLPITSRIAGTFAVDLALKGVSKTTAVKHVVENDEILERYQLSTHILQNPRALEIWGDKFSMIRGGSDRHMSQAVSKQVRSIDFREENSQEFEAGYNIVVWDGEKHLFEGTLEYLQSRPR